MNQSIGRVVWAGLMTIALAGCSGGDSQNADGSTPTGGGAGGSSGATGGDGSCKAEPDTSNVDAFFSTLSCTWTLYAEDRIESGTTDARFVHGKAYEVVLRADKTLTLESEDGEIVYEYGAAADSYSDEDHEANVFLRPSGESVIIQYDKAAGSLQVVLSATSRDYDWSFTSSMPPSVLEAEDVGFMAGTWTSKLTYAYSDSGTTEAELCDAIEVVIDEQGNAEVTLAGDTVPFPFDKGATFVGASGTIGDKDIFRLERCAGPKDGYTCDITELGVWWSRPTGTTDPPTLYKIQATLESKGGGLAFYTADESQLAAKCP